MFGACDIFKSKPKRKFRKSKRLERKHQIRCKREEQSTENDGASESMQSAAGPDAVQEASTVPPSPEGEGAGADAVAGNTSLEVTPADAVH